MRVAYVCADPGVPVYGMKGSSIHVQEVIRALLQEGAQVELFAARIGGAAPVDLAALQVHALPWVSKGDTADRERALLDTNVKLRSLLLTHGPFDLVYERYSLWSYAAMEYACDAGIPGVLEVNAPLIDEQAQHRELVNRAAAEDVACRAFSAARTLVAVSSQVADYLKRTPGISERVQVIPNGVNTDRFPLEPLPKRPARTKFTIGFVGTLKPWHGLPVLLEAFELFHQQVTDSCLLIVGDGPEREALQVHLASRGLSEHVTFTGAVPPDCIPRLLASMDVATAPYGNIEGFYFSPLKVYEYMAAGLPVIAGDIGQLRDLIDHGRTGLLYPAGAATELTAALWTLHANAELRRHLGNAARKTVLSQHTWRHRVRQILSTTGLASPVQECAPS